ncbi:MAG: hypothetical protein ICV87_10780, partial [Gemmatimonadetes bacterium]|nr:hypothetical protein [Gemmatimonadota bacterium]
MSLAPPPPDILPRAGMARLVRLAARLLDADAGFFCTDGETPLYAGADDAWRTRRDVPLART